MMLVVGRYQFPANAAAVTSRVVGLDRAENGRPLRTTLAIDVTATIFCSGQADAAAKETAVRAALLIPYQDVSLLMDDNRPSALTLLNRTSLSGVVVTSGPDFTEAAGPEYVVCRRLKFSAEATYLVPTQGTGLVSYRDSLTIQGNGLERRNWRFPLNARPIRQVVSPYSLITVTQSGTAVGHLARPTPPAPLWPQYLVNEARAITEGDSQPMGNIFVNWPVSWNYVFESDRPLTGRPPPPRF